MPALTGNKHTYMNAAIQMLQNRMIGHVDYSFTHEDFLDLFVPPHLHETAIEVPKHFHLPYRSTNVQHSISLLEASQTCAFVAQLHDCGSRYAPMVPRKPIEQPEKSIKFLPVLDALERISDMIRRFSLAKRVLTELNERCSSAQQIRFFWPTMLILMENSNDEPTKNAAEKLRAVRAPKTLPVLPVWLRTACRETSEIITAASLIPEKPSVPVEVTLFVQRLSPFNYYDATIRCDL